MRVQVIVALLLASCGFDAFEHVKKPQLLCCGTGEPEDVRECLIEDLEPGWCRYADCPFEGYVEVCMTYEGKLYDP